MHGKNIAHQKVLPLQMTGLKTFIKTRAELAFEKVIGEKHAERSELTPPGHMLQIEQGLEMSPS